MISNKGQTSIMNNKSKSKISNTGQSKESDTNNSSLNRYINQKLVKNSLNMNKKLGKSSIDNYIG